MKKFGKSAVFLGGYCQIGRNNAQAAMARSGLKPSTDVASNLFAIDLRLDVRIACDGLQKMFQHAECFTCDPLNLSQF